MTVPQEALDAAAAEIGRQMHGGPADPDDIKFASEVLAEAAPAIAAAVQARIIGLIEAEGKRLTNAAILHMAGSALDDGQMINQVIRGSTIGNLAKRLPDLIGGAS